MKEQAIPPHQIKQPGVYVEIEESLEFAAMITEHLLDNCPHLLHQRTLEEEGNYTEHTFELQDSIQEAVEKLLHHLRLPYKEDKNPHPFA